MDSAQERTDARLAGEFDTLVEAVRVGTIFAHDNKQHEKWTRRKPTSRQSRSLTGAALEAAVMGIASMFPDNVHIGGAA